jgi:hypothetical protein
MLTFISDKFSRRLAEPLHEPRAALFVNRFTRTATIMYATSGVTEILGLSPRQLISKSIFYCIQERCLRDAVRCLEGAKSNDSIAYLRFWFRNPLQDDDVEMGGNGNTPSSGATTDPFGSMSPSIELEAVVSCTSDGLVVILRRARAPAPTTTTPLPPQPVPVYANGLFAAPWALEPVFSYGTTSYPHDGPISRSVYPEQKRTLYRDDTASHMGANAASSSHNFTYPPQPGIKESGHSGPPAHNLMDTIRDVAVFAWGIVGINRSLERYKCGTPTGDAQPAGADGDGDVKVEDNWKDEAAAGRSWD